MGYCGRLAFVLAMTISVCSLSLAQARRGGRPNTAAVAAAPDAAPERLLRDAQLRYVEGKTEEAAALCQRLMEEDSALRLRALYLLGRSLWDGDDARDRLEARKTWDELARQAGDDRGDWVHLAIAKSLVLEDKSPKDAIATLQQAVNKEVAGLVTAEARIELARMLGDARRIEEAKSCLEAAEKSVKEQTRGYAAAAEPYQKAIDKVRKGFLEEQNPGLAEVEAADALLHDKQYAQAGQAYGEIIQRYPSAESADRAQVGLGQALCGLNRSKEALAILNKFIAAKPAGRWRGQAFAATLDVLLEGQGTPADLLKTAEWADTSISLGLTDKESGPSWKLAELDLQLRIGIARWVHGKGAQAALNFERVKTLTAGDAAKAIEALIPIVKANKAILPEGVMGLNKQGQPDRAGLSLALAVVHGMAGKNDSAMEYATRVAAQRVASRPEQVAFAQFLQVCIDEVTGQSADTQNRYQQLAKRYGQVPWADEVMYRLGALQDTTAAAATDTDPLGLEGVKGRAPRESTEDALASALSGEVDANVQDAYRAVIDKWPLSPRRERAMWRLGRILLDGNRGEDADIVFAQQLKDYPGGAYAGDAIVRLTDVALEHRFDLRQARQLADMGGQWAQSDLAARQLRDAVELEPWRMMGRQPNLPVGEWVKYEVFLRAGLVAYLDENFAEAITLFELARPTHYRAGAIVATKHSDLSLSNITGSAKGRYLPWDIRAIEACRTDQQRLAVKLGDLYIHAVRSDKALEIFERFDRRYKVLLPIGIELHSYTQERLALALSESRKNIPRAIAIYARFYDPPLNKTLFAPESILQLGVLKYNTTQNSENSMPHYEYLLKHYPDHSLAEKAMYFYTMGAIRTKQTDLARECVKEFCARYASSVNAHWRDDVRTRLAELERQSTGN